MFNTDPLWVLENTSYTPENEMHAEALCTLGNGYMGCRGAWEEAQYNEIHYPGLYLAGLYNRLVSHVAGRDVENEDFVNCPDWTWITFRTPGGDWFHPDQGELLMFHRQLDMQNGRLLRELRFQHGTGEITHVRSTRIVSMAHRHLAGIRYEIIPENYEGEILIRSGLNGAIENMGVERYRELNQRHLEPDCEVADGATLMLGVKTVQSNVTIVERARHRLFCAQTRLEPEPDIRRHAAQLSADFTVTVAAGKAVSLEKTVAVVTSRDPDVSDPYAAAKRELAAAPDWEELIEEQATRWADIWNHIDLEIDGDETAQQINRLHAFHLMVTASPFNADLDASLPARGLHGEAYRGHIFWDDIFVFPFYNLHYPEISRALLRYRYRRLDAARAYARDNGYRGAMFPWQSGSDGREETQVLHLNPVSGEWGPDSSCLQRHVSLAVAYNTWTYYHATLDREFLEDCGAEMLLSIARFWAGKCEWNADSKRYEIHGVMGPNEFHEHMPGAEEGGLKDNAYTNLLAVWVLDRAMDALALLPTTRREDLCNRLEITDAEIETWRKITQRMNVVIKNGIISQYDGFLDLKELDWEHYRKTYGNISRLDRLLKAEGLVPDEYQVSKQGDLMMLFYVLPLEDIHRMFTDLGLEFNEDILRRNYDYYLRRTTHGSTLSLGVHAHTAILLGDLAVSMDWYRKALHADVKDIQGGTTKEGIHAALMASTINLTVYGYGGVDLWQDHVRFRPHLPDDWRAVRFNFIFQGTRYFVNVTHQDLTLTCLHPDEADVPVEICGRKVVLSHGKERTVPWKKPEAATPSTEARS